MNKTIAIYVRVSTTGQNEAGQTEAITQWLTAHGHAPDAAVWYTDKATGSNMDRPALDKLQKAIFKGNHHTVVIWRLDRLSRKMRDGINLLAEWCDEGVRVVSVTQALDLNATVGKMIAGVLLAVGEMEREAILERQRVGIDAALKRGGVYKGRKPGTLKGKPERARKLRDKGLTQFEIATAMGVSRSTVVRYLNAP